MDNSNILHNSLSPETYNHSYHQVYRMCQNINVIFNTLMCAFSHSSEFHLWILFEYLALDFDWSASSIYSMMVHGLLMLMQHDETKHPLSYICGGWRRLTFMLYNADRNWIWNLNIPSTQRCKENIAALRIYCCGWRGMRSQNGKTKRCTIIWIEIVIDIAYIT